MKKRSKRISRKKNSLSISSFSLIVISMLMALYFISSGISETQFAGFMAPSQEPPSDCGEGTADVSIISSQFVDNAIFINISSPSCVISTTLIRLGVPNGINLNLDGLTGTGAFDDKLKLRSKDKGDLGDELRIKYFDFSNTGPTDTEGTITIPFSASQPGEYIFTVNGNTRFRNENGALIRMRFNIPPFTLQMFNFSFYVKSGSSIPAPTASNAVIINKVPVGAVGDAVLNTTVAGNFKFNMEASDGIASLSRLTTVTTQNPIYTWKGSFDSYLHPESKHTCNAGKVNASVILNYNNNLVTNNIEVELTKPKLTDIYTLIDQYFDSIGTDTEDPTLIPRAYYMVGSYFNCP